MIFFWFLAKFNILYRGTSSYSGVLKIRMGFAHIL